jgi:glycosyltransferase involved in cell wall biosynthesis
MNAMASVLMVTPSYNSAETIDDTILSVVSQGGEFDLHYHVQDGGSDDGTLLALARWDETIRSGILPARAHSLSFSYASEPDRGMYEAINRGFDRAQNAEIMSWINADDRLQPGAIQTAVSVFSVASDVRWLGGRHSYCDESGMPIATLDLKVYSRDLLSLGFYEGRKLFFMQQEGVFWKRGLWQSVGGKLDDSLRWAGDFDLWRRFAEYSDYISVDAVLGNFRIRRGQATSKLDLYYGEVDRILVPLSEKRESTWRALISGTRLNASLDLSGRIARYDGIDRSWILEKKTASVQFPHAPGPLNRAREVFKDALYRLGTRS